MVDLFHWRSLTTAINKIMAPPAALQNLLFRDSPPLLSKYIDLDIVIGGQKLAPFVTSDDPGIVVGKTGQAMASIEAPRIRPKKFLKASDLLSIRSPGSQLYVGPGGIEAYQREKIGRELLDLKSIITRTKEWMCAQALTGTLTVEQANVHFTIDYLMPAANKPVLTGTDLWTNAASKPWTDILEWQLLIGRASGYSARMALLGKNVALAILEHANFLAKFNMLKVDVGTLRLLLTQNQPPNNLISLGTYAGIDLYLYSGAYDKAGTMTPFIDDDYFVLVAPDAPFTIEYGLIEDLEVGAQIALPFFSKSWIEKDPSVQWLLAESRPLPIPHWPEAIVYAKVA